MLITYWPLNTSITLILGNNMWCRKGEYPLPEAKSFSLVAEMHVFTLCNCILGGIGGAERPKGVFFITFKINTFLFFQHTHRHLVNPGEKLTSQKQLIIFHRKMTER